MASKALHAHGCAAMGMLAGGRGVMRRQSIRFLRGSRSSCLSKRSTAGARALRSRDRSALACRRPRLSATLSTSLSAAVPARAARLLLRWGKRAGETGPLARGEPITAAVPDRLLARILERPQDQENEASPRDESKWWASGWTKSVPALAAGSMWAPAIPGALAKFLAVAPSAMFFFLQISGLKTVKEIKQRGDTGDLNPLQFVSLAANCVVWTLYGVLRGDMAVIVPNASGALFGLYYTSVFKKYTKMNMAPYLLGGVGVVGAVAAMAVGLPAAAAADYIGYTGCTLAVLLMSAPLAVMKTVIKTKNTSAMPFNTSLATLLNAAAWSSYGWLVAHDPIMVYPNLLGLAAATVQLGMFARYGIHSADDAGKATAAATGEEAQGQESTPPEKDDGTWLTSDGGVRRKVIQAGNGETPPQGSTVSVHYTGRLADGTKFDSSKDRGIPLEFALGTGQVIGAWDLGIAAMSKGEVCELTCASQYAYGARGAGGVIPPHATLVFEVELLDWQ